MTRAVLDTPLRLSDVFDPERPGGGEPHPAQRAIIASPARFRVAVTGRRFGKTHLGLHDLVDGALRRPRYPFWYVAPSYRQAKMIAWPILKRWAAGPLRPVVKAVVETELEVRFTNGGVVALKGADNEDSLRGPALGGVNLDEYATMGSAVWEEILRPSLADVGGWALFTGTPKPVEHFRALYERARAGDPEWAAFHFTTYDNPHIPREEVEAMRRDLSALTFRQEVLAEFVGGGGLIFPMFDPAIHVIDNATLPPALRRVRALDPGMRHPTACLWMVADREGTVIVEDEYCVSDKTIREHAFAIRAQHGGRGLAYTVIDPSAAHRDPVTGLSLQLEYARHGLPTRPAVNDVALGIEAVRKRLEPDPVTTVPRLAVMRRCGGLIRELLAYRWADLRDAAEYAVRAAPHKVQDDLCDALRYAVATPGLEASGRGGVGSPTKLPFEISLIPEDAGAEDFCPVTGVPRSRN